MENGELSDSGRSGSTDGGDQADLAQRARHAAERIHTALTQAKEVLEHRTTHEVERAKDLIFCAGLEAVSILQLFPEKGSAEEGFARGKALHGEDPQDAEVSRLELIDDHSQAANDAHFNAN